VLFKADVHVDPVSAQADVIHCGQAAGREGALLSLHVSVSFVITAADPTFIGLVRTAWSFDEGGGVA